MSDGQTQKAWRLTLIAVVALTAIRIAVLIASPLELYPDEGQYWWWARNLDFGYFSKPPLIAWIIYATTRLFGDSEWAIRLASPLLHGGTALLIFAFTRELRDARTALWSALAYATLPGVAYSCGLISTDVPLLFCWALGLYALIKAGRAESWRWPLIAGIAIGLGMLAKYAMLYFVGGALIAALVSPLLRRAGRGGRVWLMAAVALLVFSPNLIWNWAHHFPTVGHTAHNADWSHARYSFDGLAGFVGGQFGVFGPVLMAGFLVGLWRLRARRGRGESALILAAFALPPLVLITLQSFIAEANANWAATAYVTATPMAVSVLMEANWALIASFAIDGFAMVVLWLVVLSPPFGERIGVGNAFKRQEGWSTLGRAVTRMAEGGPYRAIAVANRSLIAEMAYYARPRRIPLRSYAHDTRITDHFDMTMRLERTGDHLLLALMPEEAALILPSFESVRYLGRSDTPIGGHHHRVVLLFDARGYAGPPRPR